MNKYHETITLLFELLAQANQATSSDNRQGWQEYSDSRQTDYYGHLSLAIHDIAGSNILDHWYSTLEVDLDLANRNVKPAKKTN